MAAKVEVELVSSNLRDVVKLLWNARPKWYELGLELGIHETDLKVIKMNNSGAEECFREMISHLLKMIEPFPSWQDIVKALCQPTVDCKKLASDIANSYNILLPDNYNMKSKLPLNKDPLPAHSTICRVLSTGSLLLLCVLTVLAAVHMGIINHNHSNINLHLHGNLPKLEGHDKLIIGRERDMTTVMEYFTNRSVVTLYGMSGFGKTHLAKHIGHKMKALGFSVFYVRVEDYIDIDGIKNELKKITKVPLGTSLRDWAESLHRKTLLILDNVDGKYWAGNSSRLQLQKHLIDVLVQYSDLKVLTTSQEKLHIKYQSHQLHPLSTKNCSHLFKELVKDIECSVKHADFISDAYSEAICKLVGNTPLIINILAKTFLCSDPKHFKSRSVHQLFKDIVKRQQDDTDPFGPFKLAFDFVSEECQRYSLLLYKFPGSFTIEDSMLLVSSDMLGAGTEDNYTIQSACLLELSKKSFIEKRFDRFSFHVLVRVFLNSTLQQNMTAVRHAFWENYFSWQYYYKPEHWKPVDVYGDDVELFAEILNRRSNNSYPLVFFVTKVIALRNMMLWDSPHYLMISHHYNEIVVLVAEFLHSDCQYLNWPYSRKIQIADLFSAYNTLFTIQVRQNLNLDMLVNCEQRAKQLHLLAKGDHEVMFNRSVFHNRNVEGECKLIQNSHAICRKDRWQFRLLDLTLQLQSKPCRLFNSSMTVLFLAKGLDHYALMENNKAIPYFKLALKYSQRTNFSKLHATMAHIALYSTYVKLNDSAKADETLKNLLRLYSQCSNLTLTCYAPIYGYIVIPFLHSVNATELESELCNAWLESYQAHHLQCTDVYSLLYRKKLRGDILGYSFCNNTMKLLD